jgi:mRNA interferase MazF
MRRPGSTLTSGDVVHLDLGLPIGREAGFRHPAVVVTGQRILSAEPSVVHVVPLTSTIRRFYSEITIEPDERNGLTVRSAAQCQHLRPISRGRIASAGGNVGAVALAQIREAVAAILDLPS